MTLSETTVPTWLGGARKVRGGLGGRARRRPWPDSVVTGAASGPP
jgi:hypothetical protein